VRRGGGVVPLLEGGLPLGVDPQAEFPVEQGTLGGGDALVLYSDGISDARDGGGEPLGWERLLELLTVRHERASALLGGVLEGVRAYAAGAAPLDDQTLLVARRLEVVRG